MIFQRKRTRHVSCQKARRFLQKSRFRAWGKNEKGAGCHDTGKYTLRPAAREKLAKISGIILVYPDLKLAIEGNTDSVGGDALNQELSEQRAGAVRDYLAKENIPLASMTSRGFGKTQPVASNDTAEGRQQNRRVELVVSGDVIGTTIGAFSQDLPTTKRQ
jgi:outer membrane protein OmpA-like peptidoglycan-associated protein